MMISAIQGVDACVGAFDTGMGILTMRNQEIRMERALEQTTLAYHDLAARYDELLARSTAVTDKLQAQVDLERQRVKWLQFQLDAR